MLTVIRAKNFFCTVGLQIHDNYTASIHLQILRLHQQIG